MTTSRDRTWWRHLAGWRHQARALLVAALGPAVLVLTAAPAGASEIGSAVTAPFTDPRLSPAVTAVRVLVVMATAVVAGAGLCRALLPVSAVSPAARRTVGVAAAVAAATAAAAGLLGQASLPLAAVQVIVTLAVAAALPFTPVATLAAVALAALLAMEVSGGSSGAAAVLESIYVVGAALLGGSSVLAATGDFGDATSRIGRAGSRRLARVAVTAGVLVTAAGTAGTVVAGPHTVIDLLHTGFGRATLVALALPLVATVTWALAWSAARVSFAGAGRVAVVGSVVAVGAVSLLATLPPPAAAPLAGRPLLRPVALPDHQMSLLVTPALPGRNLVRLSGPPGMQLSSPDVESMPGMASMPGMTHTSGAAAPLRISAGGVPVSVTPRQGASGGWAVLDIPAGTRQLTVSHGESSVPVPVDVGSRAGTADQVAMQTALAGPNGPECADAVVGGLLADAAAPLPTACPSQRLEPADAEALRVVVDSLADRGVHSVALAQDTSPRSQEAAATVRSEATRRGLAVPDAPEADSAVVVASGWTAAVDTLRAVTRQAADAPTATGGTYLAPWLLTGKVITGASSSVLPLRFNPQEVGPRQYAATLASVFPDSVPSEAGYTSWARATQSVVDHRVTLYGAAPVSVPMGMDMDMGMADAPGQWFPGGSIVPISKELTGS